MIPLYFIQVEFVQNAPVGFIVNCIENFSRQNFVFCAKNCLFCAPEFLLLSALDSVMKSNDTIGGKMLTLKMFKFIHVEFFKL